MKVLQLLSSTGFHGAESMTAELVRQLHVLGVTVEVAVLDNAGAGNDQIFQAVGSSASHCSRLPCNGAFDFQTVAALKRYVRERQIDIVHSHKYKTTFYALAARLTQSFGVLTTYHNWLTDTPALRAYAMLDKCLARFNSQAVAVSTPIRQELGAWMSDERILQIDNGVDTQKYVRQAERASAKQALGHGADTRLLGFVGRLSVEKGLPYLLEAVQGCLDERTRLLVVGDGPMGDALRSQAQAMGIGERVEFLGNRQDTPWIYSALDALVLPSTVEAFPMVLLEAMACDCPVIATRVGEVARIVDPGQTGLIVPSGDVAQLRMAIESLLGDAQLRVGMGAAGRDKVVSNFSSARMARRYLEAYEGIIKRQGC
jgi:glycosyltransferase involved in cell wall biosynthesis